MPTGKVFGSITTKDLSIRSGAIFVGKSNMPEGEKAIELKGEETPEESKEESKESKEKKEKTAYEIE
jgi:cytoskeletal protein CcmA (bactofilin family)